MIFSRENNGYQFRENVQEQLTLAGRTAENRLYLSSSNEWNCPQTEKAYLWFFKKLTGFMGTEMRLDATLSAIRQGGSEKSRILHEMLYADLGIKDIRITGSKEEPIIPHCTLSMPKMALLRVSGSRWGKNPLEHSVSSPASVCGLRH